MTLPGGALLILDSGLTGQRVQAFFAANGIASSRVLPLGSLPNAFVVATEPGFASLRHQTRHQDSSGHASRPASLLFGRLPHRALLGGRLTDVNGNRKCPTCGN